MKIGHKFSGGITSKTRLFGVKNEKRPCRKLQISGKTSIGAADCISALSPTIRLPGSYGFGMAADAKMAVLWKRFRSDLTS